MPEGIMSDELVKRLEKLEVQVKWIIDHNVGSVSYERVEKLEIQVNCLRKQILDLEGKKSYTEQAREYAKDREGNGE